ncbi:MAG TPA: Xaa-Pro peptidase family protein [Gaiellaceae bacterium]|nr:Xaa-Pro peptidase family protein [Gaiellaceae bacterium]
MRAVGAELPFPAEEYQQRRRRVREEMRRRELDVLLVLSPPNLAYLTGFESVWYPPRAPVGCILRAESEELVFCDYERHCHYASTHALFDDAIWFTYEDAVAQLARAFRERGLLGRVGVERWTRSPGAPLVQALEAALEAVGASVVDGSWTVDRVRAVKSPREVECVLRAAEIADAALAALPEIARPGLTELQVAARLELVMADEGGEPPAIRTMVSAGPLVWARTHSPPGRRPLERGDVLYVDLCGVYRRYHADVCRTFALGEDNPVAREILEWTSRSVDAVAAAVRPGDPLEVAVAAAERHVHERYGPERIWWIGGYALGLALPPDWVGHIYLDNRAFERFTWEPGYVTNYENVLFDREAGITASYMETLLMTEDGIRVLSSHPRTLTVLP